MTLSEFKAWFDGYTEELTGPPSLAQWEKIKTKIAKIDGAPITRTVYVDNYWPRYDRYYTSLCETGGSASLTAVGTASSFNSHDAMYMLGKAEATN